MLWMAVADKAAALVVSIPGEHGNGWNAFLRACVWHAHSLVDLRHYLLARLVNDKRLSLLSYRSILLLEG